PEATVVEVGDLVDRVPGQQGRGARLRALRRQRQVLIAARAVDLQLIEAWLRPVSRRLDDEADETSCDGREVVDVQPRGDRRALDGRAALRAEHRLPGAGIDQR